jgi:hypothetical protein
MRVGDEYRTNNLSLKPGGSIVTVVFANGGTLEYDKVKSPKKYIAAIPQRDDIIQIFVNGKEVWTNNQKVKYWEI